MSEVLMYYEIIAAYENKTTDVTEQINLILAKYGQDRTKSTSIISDLSNIYNTVDNLPTNVSDLARAMEYWARPSDKSSTYIVLGYPENNPLSLKHPDIVKADSIEKALAQCILQHKPELLDMDQDSYDSFLHETPRATFCV